MGAGICRELSYVVGQYEAKLNKLLNRTDVQIVRVREEQEAISPTGYSQADYPTGFFRVTINVKAGRAPTTTIHSFVLTPFPHCCGILISSGAVTHSEWQRKGIGRLMNQFRRDAATATGYSVLIATDKVPNEPQQKILKANNWKELHVFKNRRSGNKVAIHVTEV